MRLKTFVCGVATGRGVVYAGGMEKKVPMRVLESALENYFYRAVRSMGGKAVKLAPVEVGTPDRLVLLPCGRVYLVELKADNGALRPRQVEWHRQAAELGTTVHVLYGRDDIDRWVRELFAEVDEVIPNRSDGWRGAKNRKPASRKA